jgi:adenosylhomocysteine nucleosidase
MKALIITPMQEELDIFLQTCTSHGLGAEHTQVGRLPVIYSPSLDITLARGGVGKAQFALQTQHLLESGLHPDLVICTGAAGGLVDDLSIGDVVVATSTIEHDYTNKFISRPLPSFVGDERVIAELRGAASSCHNFAVHFGPVASGDEDIVDADRRQVLHRATGALAAAWEGAGGARACRFNDVPFLEIRGVTDAADPDAPSDFWTNLGVAMANTAVLITTWLDQTIRLPRLG